MKTLMNRLYGNYLMPSRLDQFDDFVRIALAKEYVQTSVREFFRTSKANAAYEKKVIVHRHDIDSDTRTARKLFNIEKKYGIKSSYYFRISTLDFDLMREIENYGSEASYHYEEIATFAKRNNIKCAAEIRKHISEIRDEFYNNFNLIEKQLGEKISTVASHGDFANRILHIANSEILEDSTLRKRCGIECETYDCDFLNNFDVYITDRPYPQYYYPMSPFDSIEKYNRICFLTHPMQWETNWIENTKTNFIRFNEGIKW